MKVYKSFLCVQTVLNILSIFVWKLRARSLSRIHVKFHVESTTKPFFADFTWNLVESPAKSGNRKTLSRAIFSRWRRPVEEGIWMCKHFIDWFWGKWSSLQLFWFCMKSVVIFGVNWGKFFYKNKYLALLWCIVPWFPITCYFFSHFQWIIFSQCCPKMNKTSMNLDIVHLWSIGDSSAAKSWRGRADGKERISWLSHEISGEISLQRTRPESYSEIIRPTGPVPQESNPMKIEMHEYFFIKISSLLMIPPILNIKCCYKKLEHKVR